MEREQVIASVRDWAENRPMTVVDSLPADIAALVGGPPNDSDRIIFQPDDRSFIIVDWRSTGPFMCSCSGWLVVDGNHQPCAGRYTRRSGLEFTPTLPLNEELFGIHD